ncbi:hypothetical protein P167DRAFT_579578 [Morchella conica CCBAS932]|uniref:Uncharacterized protein n=1 Tax=Morchella conica CCBAS932 TaxID=1392247 RepID=A0A3N4K9B6_9PEZI|nr:hypothetical protein P167DRAFT_579578 [Morchella conica CCBAS932]
MADSLNMEKFEFERFKAERLQVEEWEAARFVLEKIESERIEFECIGITEEENEENMPIPRNSKCNGVYGRRNYSAKEYNRGKDVTIGIRDYGL